MTEDKELTLLPTHAREMRISLNLTQKAIRYRLNSNIISYTTQIQAEIERFQGPDVVRGRRWVKPVTFEAESESEVEIRTDAVSSGSLTVTTPNRGTRLSASCLSRPYPVLYNGL